VSNDKRRGWLAGLREKDTVIIVSRHGSDRTETVSRVTPTGIIKVGLYAFNPNGYLRSNDPWSYIRLVEPTTERLENIKRQDLIDRCHRAFRTDPVRNRISLPVAKRIYKELLPAIRGDAEEVKP